MNILITVGRSGGTRIICSGKLDAWDLAKPTPFWLLIMGQKMDIIVTNSGLIHIENIDGRIGGTETYVLAPASKLLTWKFYGRRRKIYLVYDSTVPFMLVDKTGVRIREV